MTEQPIPPDQLEEALKREWYHTIELAPGAVTPGWFDLRRVAGKLPWPSLSGARCLDVGTFDGFWAFEMERRGASEVLAIDILDPRQWDWPANTHEDAIEAVGRRKGVGEGFEVARAALGSAVKRRELSVYDLDPADVGLFDVVYLGSILLHLRDPVRALERVRSVCRGKLLSVDTFDVWLTLTHPRLPVASLDAGGRPWWWRANLAGIRRMIEAGGFEVETQPRLLMPPGAGQPKLPIKLRGLRHVAGRSALLTSRVGDPHVATLAH
jgi:tRNA (mo5U34)-methyltransferase